MTDILADKINLLGMDKPQLTEFFENIGEKPYRATQILKWIHQRKVTDFSLMTDLNKNLRSKLDKLCFITAPAIKNQHISSDGTVKWLMQLSCGNLVETVFIPEKNRGTLCVSSQIGCALNCTFCSTATQGFNRNLASFEIIGQLWQAEVALADIDLGPMSRKVTNVVMMGMGEPLLNFDNLVASLRIMREENAYCLSKRRVTVSTSGVVPGIDKLKHEVDVALALSLHAPDDELRNQIVPINKKYNLKILLDSCKQYAIHHGKLKVTMEYVMLKGINDSLEQARALAKLLHNMPCKINLIPFNPFPGTKYECSAKSHIQKFQKILMDKGYVTTIRTTRGNDIDAACGQLVGNFKDKTKRRFRLKEERREDINVPIKVSS